MDIAIRFSDLTLGYDRHPAVHHFDAEVESGALLAICGPNGAGKSTLLKGIAGTLSPLTGSIALPCIKPRDIAYLPQAADIDKVSRLVCSMSLPWGYGPVAACSAAFPKVIPRKSAKRSRRSGSMASNHAPSARFLAVNCSGCCSPGFSCKTPPYSA